MRVQMRLRALLFLVAMVALAEAGWRAAVTMRARAAEYARDARWEENRRRLDAFEAELTRDPKAKAALKKSEDWHAARSAEYTRAASRPWLVVPDEPGPPAPTPAPGEAERQAAAREDIHRKLDALQAELGRTVVPAKPSSR